MPTKKVKKPVVEKPYVPETDFVDTVAEYKPKYSGTITARQLTAPEQIALPNGDEILPAGMWVVVLTDLSGKSTLIKYSDTAFKENFEPK